MARTINVTDIPKAGPYSHAVLTGNLLFLSGQVGTVPNKSTDLEEQFINAMTKVKKILEEGGFGIAQVVKTTVYLAKKEDFQKMNELYSRYFKENHPARTTVVAGFPNGETLVEIDVIASK